MSELVQSDGVGLLVAREATRGTQPTTGWQQLQPNSSGLTNFTRTNTDVERDTLLSPNLTSERGIVVGYDLTPQLVHDLNMDYLYTFAELIMRSSTKWPGGTGLGFFRPTAITTGAWTVAANGAVPDGTLVRCDGATNAANNGLHVTAGTSTGTSIKTGDTLVAETPPANCVVRVCGVQGTSTDITLDASGNLLSTVLDFTTIGAVVGSPIIIGDPASGAAYAFATDLGLESGAGLAVIEAIAAHKITLRRRSFAPGVDAGTGKTIRLLLPALLVNVPLTDGSYLRPSVSAELSLPGAGDAGVTTYRYGNGWAASSLKLDIATHARITATLAFVGMTLADPTSTRGTGASTALAPLLTTLFSTAAEMRSERLLTQADETAVSTLISQTTITIDNKITPLKAHAYDGAVDLIYGKYTDSADLTHFVRDDQLTLAIDQDTDCTYDMLARNGDGGFWMDLPMVKVRKGDLTFAANAAVTQATTLMANRDPSTGIQRAMALFAYVP